MITELSKIWHNSSIWDGQDSATHFLFHTLKTKNTKNKTKMCKYIFLQFLIKTLFLDFDAGTLLNTLSLTCGVKITQF